MEISPMTPCANIPVRKDTGQVHQDLWDAPPRETGQSNLLHVNVSFNSVDKKILQWLISLWFQVLTLEAAKMYHHADESCFCFCPIFYSGSVSAAVPSS